MGGELAMKQGVSCVMLMWRTQQFENSLRRHNHVGLVHALLLALAKADKLSDAQESAKKLMEDRVETRRKKGESMEED